MQHKNSTTNSQPAEALPGRRSRGRGIWWFLAIPLVLLVSGAAVWSIHLRTDKTLAANTQASVSEPVTVTQPQRRTNKNDISLPSTLQAYSDSPIYARTSGYVAHWYADIGTRVQAGELLAVIESPEVDQELNQARASLSQAQANLTLADVTAKRYLDLIPTHAVAQQQVDQNNQNLDARKAGLQGADANVKRLEQMQGFERVVAPFTGVITQRLTDIGDLVNAGNSGSGAQLFRISKIDVMRVFVPVPEVYGGQIRPGLTADLDLTELPQAKFAGAVVRTSHSIDPGSHTLLTEIDVPNPSGKLLPGAYANVHIRLAGKAQDLVVPSGAVLFQADGPQVVLVNSSNQLELRKISIARDFGNLIQVTGGLASTDRIVASPPDYVVNGMPANIEQQTSGNANQPPANEKTGRGA